MCVGFFNSFNEIKKINVQFSFIAAALYDISQEALETLVRVPFPSFSYLYVPNETG